MKHSVFEKAQSVLDGWKEFALKESEEKQLLINLMVEHYNDPCSVAIKKYLSRKEIKNET